MTVSGLTIIKRASNLVFKEFRENKSLLFQIIGISFLCAILKHIQSSFGGNVSEIAFYVCYMLIIVLIIAISAFADLNLRMKRYFSEMTLEDMEADTVTNIRQINDLIDILLKKLKLMGDD